MWEEHSVVPPEVKDLLNNVNRTLVEAISWEQLGKYQFASQTLTVPWACRAEWKVEFQLPLYLWKEGFTEDSLKLHCIMIQMLAALMPTKTQAGQDEVEGQVTEHQG